MKLPLHLWIVIKHILRFSFRFELWFLHSRRNASESMLEAPIRFQFLLNDWEQSMRRGQAASWANTIHKVQLSGRVQNSLIPELHRANTENVRASERTSECEHGARSAQIFNLFITPRWVLHCVALLARTIHEPSKMLFRKYIYLNKQSFGINANVNIINQYISSSTFLVHRRRRLFSSFSLRVRLSNIRMLLQINLDMDWFSLSALGHFSAWLLRSVTRCIIFSLLDFNFSFTRVSSASDARATSFFVHHAPHHVVTDTFNTLIFIRWRGKVNVWKRREQKQIEGEGTMGERNEGKKKKNLPDQRATCFVMAKLRAVTFVSSPVCRKKRNGDDPTEKWN